MELIPNRSLVYNHKPNKLRSDQQFRAMLISIRYESPPQYGKLAYFQIAFFRWFEGVISVLHQNKAKQLFLHAIM